MRQASVGTGALFPKSLRLPASIYKIFQYAFGISAVVDASASSSSSEPVPKTNYVAMLNGIFESFSALDPNSKAFLGSPTEANKGNLRAPSNTGTMDIGNPTAMNHDAHLQSGSNGPFDFAGPAPAPEASNFDFQHVALAFTIAIVGTFVFTYFVLAFTRWLFGCSGFWKRPGLAECVRRMDQYYEVMDPKHFDSLTIHSTDREGAREMFEPVPPRSGPSGEGDVSINISDSIVHIGDNAYSEDYDDDRSFRGSSYGTPSRGLKSRTTKVGKMLKDREGGGESGDRRKKHDAPFYEFYTNNRGDENILEFIRGDFVMLLVTMMQIALILGVLTFTFWALGTDLLSVSAYLGIAWTALWFQSGIATMFGSFFSYIAVLISNKYRLGSLVYVPGQMAEKVGCVVDITPLRLCLVVKSSGTMDPDSTQLSRLDIPISTILQVPTYEVLKVKHTDRKKPDTVRSTNAAGPPSSSFSSPFASSTPQKPTNADPSSSSSVFTNPQQQQQQQQQFQQISPYSSVKL